MPTYPFVLHRLQGSRLRWSGGESSSRAGADELAASINRYWAERGYDAEARVVERGLIGDQGDNKDFKVVSNLVNGIPTRRLVEKAAPGQTE